MSGQAPPPPPPPPRPPSPPSGGRPPRVGELVGHYRVDSVLGVGGMGMVFSATDTRLQRQVALKVMLGHVGTSPEFQRRFQREASVLARLDSPHVVAIYDHGEQDGWPFIVTQYAAGGDLGAMIRNGGPLSPPLAFRVCAQVADALSAAHSVGVVHRDVKPANVLLRDERTDRVHIYLCDFGVATTEGAGLTTPGAVAGTWNYLAPERAAGDPGTPASDVYSVGCLLYECLTGRPPYTGADVSVAMAHLQQPVPQLPGEDDLTTRVNQVLAGALAKDPAERYDSARALRDALRELGGGLTPSTPTSPPLVLGRRRRRRRLLVASGVATALVLGGVATGVLLTSGDDDPTADPDPAPTSGSPAPTATGDPVPEPTPEVVTGDLDHDGLGDVAPLSYDGSWLMRSNGTRLAKPRRLPGVTPPAVTGDVDGDGRLDVVTMDGEPPSMVARTRLASGTEQTSLVRSGAVDDILADHIPFVADVDGDERQDLGVVTIGDGRILVTVARGRGDGTFGSGKRWLRGDAPRDSPGGGQVALGDLTGDGLADLVFVAEAETETRLRVLVSTGSAFEAQPPSPVPFDLRYESWRAGDFDGDGTDELAVVQSGPRVTVYSWEDGRFTTSPWIDALFEEGYTILGAGVTDIDGDGDDDLALHAYQEGIVVLTSSTNAFTIADDRPTKVPSRMLQLDQLGPISYK
ncbi:protein kinase domain-containing protein [Nocardioides lijunqiniae]|uniref:protein kinase domain-containing protein n=1 Tax=Nocardioides lijunqiniae TaxID=2760832 RepID=UPI00187799D6